MYPNKMVTSLYYFHPREGGGLKIPTFAGMTFGVMTFTIQLLIFFVAPASAQTLPSWQVLPDKSAIEWTASYGGQDVKGSFPAFTADITFDPAHLDASKVLVKIDVAKVKSSDADTQNSLPTPDWFNVVQFPVATFETTHFRHLDGDNYEAEGTLSIRDKQVKMKLPFCVKFYDDKDTAPQTHYARMSASTSINRLDFGVGQGDWAKTDAVANAVKLSIQLEAKQGAE